MCDHWIFYALFIFPLPDHFITVVSRDVYLIRNDLKIEREDS